MNQNFYIMEKKSLIITNNHQQTIRILATVLLIVVCDYTKHSYTKNKCVDLLKKIYIYKRYIYKGLHLQLQVTPLKKLIVSKRPSYFM